MKIPGHKTPNKGHRPQSRIRKPEFSVVAHSGTRKSATMRWMALAIFSFTILLYSNTFRHGFVLDDDAVISANSLVQKGFSGIPEVLSTPHWFGFNGHNDGYRPVSLVLFCMEWALFPGQPAVGHVMNTFWYGLATIMLLFTLRKWMRNLPVWIPLLITIIFASHPVHTEVVANIKSRDEILSFLFSISTLWFIHDFLNKLDFKYLCLASVSWLLALLSKENAIAMMILMIPLLALQAPSITTYRKGAVVVSFAGTFILYALIRLYIQDWQLTFRSEIPLSDNALVAAPDTLHQVATAFALTSFYLWKCLFPSPLIADYSYGFITEFQLLNWQMILSFAVLAALVFITIRVRNRMPWISFGIWWFYSTLFIVSNVLFLTGATFAERFLFMPSLGIIMAAVFLIYYFPEINSQKGKDHYTSGKLFRSGYFRYLLGVVVVIFSFLTIQRNRDWESNIVLFESDVIVAPDHVKLNYFYATSLLNVLDEGTTITGSTREDVLDKAEMHLHRALKLYPAYADANHRMGNVYNHRGDFSGALSYFKIAVRGFNNNPDHYSDYGRALIETGNYISADSVFRIALSLNYRHIPSLLNLGVCYARQMKFNNALTYYAEVLNYDPRHFMALKNSGSACGNLADYKQALHFFNQAYQINPEDAELNHFLSMTHRHLGDEQSALFFTERFNRLSR